MKVPVTWTPGSLDSREKRNRGFPPVPDRPFRAILFFLALVLPASTWAFTPPSEADMPESITVRGKEIVLKDLTNPYRKDKEKRDQYIREGGKIYFKHCFLCHGDLLDGKGVFGDSFTPSPADFTRPQSIMSKPEAYAFWRVMKGGPGLPQKFEPWNSAMPAWEEQLDEDQVWKVLLYITATLVQRFPAVPDPEPVTPSVKLGEKLYQENCAYCHGESGDGQGPAAEFSSPQPRNFNKGQYKIRSTPFGKIPTDQDLFDMITHGMPTTSMPPWKHLSEVERWSLVKYLKTLSTKFEKFIKRNKTHKIVKVPSPPAFSLESVERGKDLYLQNCSNCHGREGRGDGSSTYKIVNIEKDQIFPRNLTQSWKFRRGDKRKDLYLTLRTGLSGTAMPRFSPRIFKDQQIWDMVHYVQTLSPSVQPPMHPVIQVKKIEGPVPGSPEDPLWKTLDAYPFPLGGQLMVSDKAYHPIVERVVVKAAHNGEEIAFYLQWDDPSHDPALASATKVTVSPPPPLPPHLRVAGGVKDERIDIPHEFPDSIALQFPTTMNPGGERPYFLNGDEENSVNLWKWESHPYQTIDMNASGIHQWKAQSPENQDVFSQATYHYGRYHLVLKRKLTTEDPAQDVQFRLGHPIPIAFNAWDGGQKETGSRKSVSSWYELILE